MAVKSWNEFLWKLADNFASMKMEILVFASWALAVGLLGPIEWLAVAGACLGGRVLNEMQWAKNATQVPSSLQ